MYDVRIIFLFDAILFAMKVGTGTDAIFASGVSVLLMANDSVFGNLSP